MDTLSGTSQLMQQLVAAVSTLLKAATSGVLWMTVPAHDSEDATVKYMASLPH